MTRTPEYRCFIYIRCCNAADFVDLSLGMKIGVKKQINWKENIIKIEYVSTGLLVCFLVELLRGGCNWNSSPRAWQQRGHCLGSVVSESTREKGEGRLRKGDKREMLWKEMTAMASENKREGEDDKYFATCRAWQSSWYTSVLPMWNLLLKTQKLFFFFSKMCVKEVNKQEWSRKKKRKTQKKPITTQQLQNNRL